MYLHPKGGAEMILKNRETGIRNKIYIYINYIGMTIKNKSQEVSSPNFWYHRRLGIRLFIIYLPSWYPELLFGRYIFFFGRPPTDLFPCRVVFLRVDGEGGSGRLFSTFDKSRAFGLFIYFIMYTNVIAKTWLGFFLYVSAIQYICCLS